MLCTNLTFVKDLGSTIYAEPIKCNRWSCDFCRPHRKKRLVAKGTSGHPDTFLTLTSSPETADTPEAAAKVLVKAWRLVRREAERRYGYKRIPFLAVFEATKSGMPHLHILLRCKWLDQAWLSARMAHHARAPIVDIRRIQRMQTVVRYLFKYIGKAPHQFGSCKRYWSSQDYDIDDNRLPASERAPAARCAVVFKRFSNYLRHAEDEGFTVRMEGEGAFLSWGRPGPEPGAP